MDFLERNFEQASTTSATLPPHQICINSGHRVSGTPDDYIIDLPRELDVSEYSHVYCSQVSMSGSRLCINSENKRFYCAVHVFPMVSSSIANTITGGRLGRNPVVCEIDEGNWTIDDIISKLNTSLYNAMINRFPDESGFPILAASSEPNSLRFSKNGQFINFTNWNAGYAGREAYYITGSVDEMNNITQTTYGLAQGIFQVRAYFFFEILDAVEVGYYYPSVCFPNTLNALLGFTSFVYPTYNNPPYEGLNYKGYDNDNNSSYPSMSTLPYPLVITSPSIYNLDCIPSLVLCSDLISTGLSLSADDQRGNVNQGLAIVATPSYGQLGLWEPNEIFHRKLATSPSQIRLYWRDTFGCRVNFYGVDHSLCLTFIKQ